MSRIKSYEQALEYIHSFDDPYLAAIRDHGKQTWGLTGIQKVLEGLGNPHLAYPVIHVAGTKGKGSTSALIAQILIEAGHRVGLYTSPHLEDWRERVQINGRMIGRQKLAELTNDARPAFEAVPGISAFEVGTALAFAAFQREKCDIAVIEVGLGGRLDATNIVSPLVSVITSISLDHMQLLGNTLGEIAGEKAAIIKDGAPAISAPQQPEALAVIEKRAAEAGSSLTIVGKDWPYRDASTNPLSPIIEWIATGERFKIGLGGLFQVENAATALAAVNTAQQRDVSISPEAIKRGLARARWPGRFEVIGVNPVVIMDGAHNPYSIRRLVESLGQVLRGRRLTVVFGCMADKDSAGMLESLLPAADRVIFTKAVTGRAAEPADLLAQARKIDPGKVVSADDDLDRAVEAGLAEAGKDGLLCITGSLSVVGEARPLMKERYYGGRRLPLKSVTNQIVSQ